MIALTTVKAALGIAATDTTNDAWLTEQTEYYTAVIQLFTRRSLVRAQYTDQFFRPHATWLQLSEWPVTSVVSVSVDAVAEASGAWDVQSAVGRLHRGAEGLGSFASARRVTVTYEAGYAPIPKDLELVLLSLLRGAYAAQATGGATAATSTATGGGDVKSVTAFGVMKVDYDVSSSSASASTSSTASQHSLEGLLGNHVGVLMRYVDHAKTLATAAG